MMFAMLLEGVTPEGNGKKLVKLMISLLFMYILIQPVISWIRQEMPLEALTLQETTADEQDIFDMTDVYQKQAGAMMQQGYEDMLATEGLPAQLRDRYEIVDVTIDDTIEVVLGRKDEAGSLVDRQLDLGQIGSNSEEEQELLTSLSKYWGIPEEDLEMKLR